MLIMSGAPGVFVDIESVFERRMAALHQHVTQGRHRREVQPFFYQVAHQLGARGGYRLAEGFRQLPPT